MKLRLIRTELAKVRPRGTAHAFGEGACIHDDRHHRHCVKGRCVVRVLLNVARKVVPKILSGEFQIPGVACEIAKFDRGFRIHDDAAFMRT